MPVFEETGNVEPVELSKLVCATSNGLDFTCSPTACTQTTSYDPISHAGTCLNLIARVITRLAGQRFKRKYHGRIQYVERWLSAQRPRCSTKRRQTLVTSAPQKRLSCIARQRNVLK